MNIVPLFSTKEREEILSYLLTNPSEEITMRGLARKLKLSPGQVHKYIGILKKEGLFERKRLKETPLTSSLRLLWNLKRIDDAGIVGILRRGFTKVAGVGMYGSWASGTNLEDSDLDLWVKTETEPKDIEIAKVRKELEAKIKVPVDVVIATPERLEHFRVKSDSFYFSLYNGKLLWGEGL
jgi:predicted nucleotidyltransferase